MGEDDWVKEAMTDDSMVVELLMRLNHSEAHSSPLKRSVVAVPPLDWGVRQPRSRQILRCSMVQVKKEGESTRGSPTTPLSWSGGTSVSGGAGGGPGDCYEESSRPAKRLSSGKSKVTAASETTIRRSRKKKTFAELKEEESLLMKERIHLKKELATLRINCEEQRTRNESLKRMKLDLHFQSAKKTATTSDALKEVSCGQSRNTEAVPVDQTPTVLPTNGKCNNLDAVLSPSSPLSDSCEAQKKDAAIQERESFFALPDLNLPFEDDSGSEVLYGMS